jgi:hypothetical protein
LGGEGENKKKKKKKGRIRNVAARRWCNQVHFGLDIIHPRSEKERKKNVTTKEA